jgi:hypothetical protein
MAPAQSNEESVMNSANGVLELSENCVNSNHLPRSVLLRGAPSARDDKARRPATDMYEFEVIAENAAYRKGERFYLTPSQAKRAYFADRRMS